MQEKRLVARLLVYWEQLRKGTAMPNFIKLNNNTIEDLWTDCFVLAVNAQKNTIYKYEYMGEQVIKAYGRDLTGMTVDLHMKQFPGSVIVAKLPDVIAASTPQQNVGQFSNEQGKVVKYRACMLPFGTGPQKITHILVGLSFKFF